ncbi:alpha/beta hydrolase [Actinorugispora endophytica]|uniref:Alpha-beta hydrolase superfamily lysophospholipase n=1 Tax=Actinorugispora endophytica TaxID=1605990 RepID=A0A4R6V3J4_9ACTN|nr:alpha/beta hydrolase [Actinorugispora endophytica]TDQ53321.1 alpha-beta hydrolase superfamily lysophospholipase [Actinorugispora endophytica]
MVSTREWSLPGGPLGSERRHVRAWAAVEGEPDHLVVLVHGYGEHIGRYEHVARWLCGRGAVCYGLDHRGHGRSSGERVLVEDFAGVVEDVHRVVTQARSAYRSLPLVLVGHSLGGLIAARYAQTRPEAVAGLVLSGPVLGRWAVVDRLLAAPGIPDAPIDTATLSRDPLVGAAYAADELVWHGPFKRPTLEAVRTELGRAAGAGRLDGVPLLWLHGSDDALVPLDGTLAGITALAGPDTAARVFPGARHEVFNETNREEVLAEVARFAARVSSA